MVMPLVVMVALLPTSALAHRPWFKSPGTPDPHYPYRLTDLDISQGTYGEFDLPYQVDYYALRAEPGFSLDVRVVVPDVPACAAFRPVMLLLGPGLPVPDPGTPTPGNDGAAAGLAVFDPSVEPGLLVATSPR